METRAVSNFSKMSSAIVMAIGSFLLLSVSCSSWPRPQPAAVAAEVRREVVYDTAHGAGLTMDVYFPPGDTCAERPAVMYVHGGGWEGGGKAMVAIVPGPAELLRRGYVVASVDYRLAPEHKFPAMLEDAKCAVRFLRAQAKDFQIDPRRIGIMGDSSGGHLAALVGLTDSRAGFDGPCAWSNETSRVQAVVDLYGPTDFTVAPKHLKQREIALMEGVFGVTRPDDPILKRASPVTYVSAGAPPFLILQGDRDPLVPLERSREFFDKLKAAGADATLVVITNFSHGFTPWGLKSRPTFAGRSRIIADFFDQHLGPSKPDETAARPH